MDRIAALKRHGILDTVPEASFDRIVAHVQAACRVPIALVSLVDTDRQWFKARAGVTIPETAIDTSVCALAIRGRELFQIGDLSADPRTAAMSLVTGTPGIRFYAGAPIVAADGAALGALCAIDTVPRPDGLTADQQAVLTMLADQVMTIIAMRSAIAERDRALAGDERLLRAQRAEVRYRTIVDSAIDSAIVSFDDAGIVTSWSKGAERILGWSAEEMIGVPGDRLFTPEDRAAGVMAQEFAIARATGRATDERWHMRRDGSRLFAHGALTPLLDRAAGGFVKSLRDITAEHETAAALQASREKLELATRAARMGQFDYLPQSGALEWDDRCRELFGLPPGAPVSYQGSYVAGLHPDDRERGTTAVEQSLDPDGPGTFDVEYRTVGIEDGVERHIHAKGTTQFDGRAPLRLIGTVQDVTAERRQRLALHQTEERLRLAGRATNDAIWDWDLVADHVTWNAAIERAYGHRLAEVEPSGRWWMAQIHPQDRARIEASIHAVIDGDATEWADEYRFARADGSHADILDRGYVLRDADGRAVRMIGAMFDQTDRKRIEQALRQQASGLAEQVEQGRGEIERLWSSSPDLLLVMDFAGLFRRVNPAWTRLLGYGEDELVGHHVDEFMVHDAADPDADEATAATEGRAGSTVNQYRHKDGSRRWFAWVAAPSDGLTYASGRDITAEVEARAVLRRTEDALRQSQKVEAMGQLTGGVAHDFNNLLTVIRGSVDLLRRPGLSAAKQARYVDAIADTADRAARLTSQLLAFARRSPLQSHRFDVRVGLRALGEMLHTLVGPRIRIAYEPGEVPLWVETDPSQFDTAIVNMAVNARDAMDGTGTLTIGIAAADTLPAIRGHPAVPKPHVAVSLIDTGTGIAPDRIEHIFEPFFTTKGVGHGTGLGLSQVFGFAKQSGGEIAVRSTVGEGTTFTLYLPRAAAGPDVPDAGGSAPRRRLRAGACILVVEDNEEVGAFATQALAELGYETVRAVDADMAEAMLADTPERFDILFSDVVMPGRSGIELAQAVRARFPALPVMLTSGYSHVLAEQGSAGFPLLRKPYSIAELAAALDAAVDGHHGG